MIGRRALSRLPVRQALACTLTLDQRDDRDRHTARFTRRTALHLNRLAAQAHARPDSNSTATQGRKRAGRHSDTAHWPSPRAEGHWVRE